MARAIGIGFSGGIVRSMRGAVNRRGYDDGVHSHIFRRYDIRGVADSQLSTEVAYGVGRALGTRIRRAGGSVAVVGQDVRESSPRLAAAACEGLAATGLQVEDLGVVPTPVWMHALKTRQRHGGIMVTGSHNPRHDNGLKCCLGSESLWGDAVTSLRTQILAEDFETGHGRVDSVDWLPTYTEQLCAEFSLKPGLKVAVDCGNGVMGPLVLQVLARMGCVVEALYCEPDGNFPNHIPDPEVPKYMADLGRRVVQSGAACGIGFDGDGDRVGLLDERGHKHAADRVIALFARPLLLQHPGGVVRYDVKCSDFLEAEIRALGGVPVMGETGHSLLKRDIAKLDAILGGELSGHIIVARGWPAIDDSLFDALFFLQILQQSGGAASSLFASFPQLCSTAEIKLPCADARKEAVVQGITAQFSAAFEVCTIDGARVRTPDGWFLVRSSNTTPNLTVRLESPDRAALLRNRQLLIDAFVSFPDTDTRPLIEETESC